MTDPETCAQIVEYALKMGYRILDTAQHYHNEEYVGNGIARSKIDRKKIFVGSKLWYENLKHGGIKQYVDKSLQRLALNYIDIMYIHWPVGPYDPETAFPPLEDLVDEGKIKHIAVSNFTEEIMDEALKYCHKPIIANQIEMHPFFKQKKMQEYLAEKNIKLVAYCPLARGKIFESEELKKIAEKYSVDEAKVTLAWFNSI
jgi:2,5-diketo-D-gluconate reductase B